MLAQYHRWIFENHRWESVETLKEFVLQEVEFQTVASETIRGATWSNRNVDSRRNRSERTFFGNAQDSETQNFASAKCAKDITEIGVVTNSKICQFKKDGIPRNA